jgi:sugar-phosphatase
MDRVVRRVIELIDERAELRQGVHEAIAFVTERVGETAIASASTTAIIDAVMRRFDLARHFSTIHSAEHEPYGKPHPGVYLTAAAKLGARPEACIALEDSINGVIAAKAARMTCIAIPEVEERTAFGVADLVLDSLLEIPTRWAEL